jgi:hypothetical protein
VKQCLGKDAEEEDVLRVTFKLKKKKKTLRSHVYPHRAQFAILTEKTICSLELTV